MKLFWTMLALGATLASAPCWAYSETHDEFTMDLKGYSPEVIAATQAMISRQEGRYPAPIPHRGKQAWYNFLNSNWDEPMQGWTHDRTDPDFFPTKPE